MGEILTPEQVAEFAEDIRSSILRSRQLKLRALRDSHAALRERSTYWEQMATSYADERNELRKQLAETQKELAEAQADVRALTEILGWAHDAIWTAHAKSENETLDDWLSKRAGWPDRFHEFTAALDSALARHRVQRVMK